MMILFIKGLLALMGVSLSTFIGAKFIESAGESVQQGAEKAASGISSILLVIAAGLAGWYLLLRGR